MSALYDVLIIGGGPAGLTAGLYAARRALKSLVLSKNLGGQAATSHDIENYPGSDIIDGLSLMQKFAKQSAKFGCEIKYSEVLNVSRVKDNFTVKTNNGDYFGKSIILACGLQQKELDIPGEIKFRGRGISYCATCDGPLYKNKTVAVIGGGNSALDAAEYLSKIAKKLYLIHRRDQFRGEELVVDRLKNDPKVEFVLSTVIVEVKGDQIVKSIILRNNGNEKLTELKIDGLFVEIGYVAKTEFIKNLVKLNKKGEIITNKDTETSMPGIFACGDVTDTSYKQVVISAGEGAKSALQVYKYLCLRQGINVLPDWNRKKECY